MNRLSRQYCRDKNCQNLAALRQAQKLAKRTYAKEKAQAFEDWCEKLNHHSTLKELWGQINIIKGRQPRDAPHPNAAEKAESLAQEFTMRTHPSNLSDKHRQALAKLNEHRLFFVQELIDFPSPEDLDRPITEKEVANAVQARKHTAPGADGISTRVLAN